MSFKLGFEVNKRKEIEFHNQTLKSTSEEVILRIDELIVNINTLSIQLNSAKRVVSKENIKSIQSEVLPLSVFEAFDSISNYTKKVENISTIIGEISIQVNFLLLGVEAGLSIVKISKEGNAYIAEEIDKLAKSLVVITNEISELKFYTDSEMVQFKSLALNINLAIEHNLEPIFKTRQPLLRSLSLMEKQLHLAKNLLIMVQQISVKSDIACKTFFIRK